MFAEEYLVERIKKLENKVAALESSNERKLFELKERADVINAFAYIIEKIMKKSYIKLYNMDEHKDMALAKVTFPIAAEFEFHGYKVCEILQGAYDNTHTASPLEPPTTDPEFNDIVHRQFKKIEDPELEEYLRSKALSEKGEEEK